MEQSLARCFRIRDNDSTLFFFVWFLVQSLADITFPDNYGATPLSSAVGMDDFTFFCFFFSLIG